MPLSIQTTGYEQYAPGGSARLKVMFIGGPGAGKTRLSSYWPKPIYADCEAGLASVADRQMPFVSIKSSKDMLEFIVMLQQECSLPVLDRRFLTVVIDTLDAFQRKIKDEWLRANPSAQAFRGYDAWGYLDAKMQMLLTRLLNLDMNIIVNVHYKDKTIKEGTGDNAVERQELMLQLQGDTKDSVFNDFDLVGWLGTYFEQEGGQRVEKRGLTFRRTPDKPFLKDRLFVTPPWMPVSFSDDDYSTLFDAFTSRFEDLPASTTIGEVPEIVEHPGASIFTPMDGGALPPMDPSEIPLSQFDKPTLVKMARDEGVEGVRSNWIKSELVAAIEKRRSEVAASVTVETPAVETPAAEATEAPAVADVPAPTVETPAAAAEATDASSASPVDPAAAVASPTPVEGEAGAAFPAADAAAPASNPVTTPEVAPTEVAGQPAEGDASTPVGSTEPAPPPVEVGLVPGETADHTTGEITAEQAAANVVASLGATPVDAPAEPVASEAPAVDAPSTAPPEPAPAAPPAASQGSQVCEQEGCGKDLSGENQDYVKLSFIKFRKRLCNEHYLEAKKKV